MPMPENKCKTINCPIYNQKVSFNNECSRCKTNGCSKLLLAIFDDCKNVNEINKLNERLLNVLGESGKITIVSNKMFSSGAEMISNMNHYEFIYSEAIGKEFGMIPEMIASHPKSAVIFTNKDVATRFAEELKKQNIKRKIPMKLWEIL